MAKKKKKNRTHAEIIDEIRELHDQEDELLDVKMKIQRELNDLTKRG